MRATLSLLLSILVCGRGEEPQAATFSGISFALGTKAFADKVEQYGPKDGAMDPFKDQDQTTGPPGQSKFKHGEEERSDVSLGWGGSIVLKFENTKLVASGDSSADLHLFGSDLDECEVYISTSFSSATKWIAVGKGTDINIDGATGVKPNEKYSFVKVKDTRCNGGASAGGSGSGSAEAQAEDSAEAQAASLLDMQAKSKNPAAGIGGFEGVIAGDDATSKGSGSGSGSGDGDGDGDTAELKCGDGKRKGPYLDAVGLMSAKPGISGATTGSSFDKCQAGTTMGSCSQITGCKWLTETNECKNTGGGDGGAKGASEKAACGASADKPSCDANTGCKWDQGRNECRPDVQKAGQDCATIGVTQKACNALTGCAWKNQKCGKGKVPCNEAKSKASCDKIGCGWNAKSTPQPRCEEPGPKDLCVGASQSACESVDGCLWDETNPKPCGKMPEAVLPDMPTAPAWMEPVYYDTNGFNPEETSEGVETDMLQKLGRKEFAAAFKLRKNSKPQDPSLEPPGGFTEDDEKKLKKIMGEKEFKSAIDPNEGISFFN